MIFRRQFRERGEAVLNFRCNVCGARNSKEESCFGRERPSCDQCGSTVRMRALIHALSNELFNKCVPVSELPGQPELRGIGLSDWVGYGKRLANKIGYQNTYYHKEPRVDICDVPRELIGVLDFVIASDVFEHVGAPVSRAFEGARSLLKPGGVFIFSVPYSLASGTVEHYPVLHEWRIEERSGSLVVVNKTEEGTEEVFESPVFHGGPGTTLEMRLFSLKGIEECCAQSGFESPPRIYSESHLGCGMVNTVGWSLVMALRPLSGDSSDA